VRRFLSTPIPCKASCKYCFAKWPDYSPQPHLGYDQEIMGENRIVLYPCCDGDYFNLLGFIEDVKHLSLAYDKIYVSLSRKTAPCDDQISQLLSLNEWLVAEEKGFVKFAIALSNRSMLEEIEPSTMSYQQRLELARVLSSLKLPLSLTLKPILPFIPFSDYSSILEDFRPYLTHVLIGGLYVNKDTAFYEKYILKHYTSTKRQVVWLPNNPEWDYIEDPLLMEQNTDYADNLNMKVFTSDYPLIRSLSVGVNA